MPLAPEIPLQQSLDVNPLVLEQVATNLLKLWNEKLDCFRRSHYFFGRYENLYLDQHLCDGLAELMATIEQQAAPWIPEIDNDEELSMMFWFNLMQQGDQTTWHNHDELFEVVSGVVYLLVPPGSAEFLYKYQGVEQSIAPKVGQVMWFNPALDHAVAVHQSAEPRLSLAFNLGVKERD